MDKNSFFLLLSNSDLSAKISKFLKTLLGKFSVEKKRISSRKVEKEAMAVYFVIIGSFCLEAKKTFTPVICWFSMSSQKNHIEKIFVTDTISIKKSKKIEIISIASHFGKQLSAF